MAKTKRWKPKSDDWYYYLTAYGRVQSYFWDESPQDHDRYQIGNCFRTEALAEKAAKAMKAALMEAEHG
jgi:hypothetical protein